MSLLKQNTVHIPDNNKNITGLLTDVSNQIGASNGGLQSRSGGGLLSTLTGLRIVLIFIMIIPMCSLLLSRSMQAVPDSFTPPKNDPQTTPVSPLDSTAVALRNRQFGSLGRDISTTPAHLKKVQKMSPSSFNNLKDLRTKNWSEGK